MGIQETDLASCLGAELSRSNAFTLSMVATAGLGCLSHTAGSSYSDLQKVGLQVYTVDYITSCALAVENPVHKLPFSVSANMGKRS